MEKKPLALELLADTFGVCRLPNDADLPSWAIAGRFFSITRTGDELSVVCRETDIPDGTPTEMGWKCLKVLGPLDFSLIGIMAALSGTLAQAGVSLFALSTFDTDYILVKTDDLPKATASLRANGYELLE